jgi:hypothetical protein
MLHLIGLEWRKGPIGRWNGRRVLGAEFSLKIHLNYWRLIPVAPAYSNSISWLCFRLGYSWVYGRAV